MAASSGQRVVVRADGGLTTRGRIAAVGITVLLLISVFSGLAAANALPFTDSRAQSDASSQPLRASETGNAFGSSSGPEAAQIIEAQWDGPAVHLDWTGAEYARAETTFIGDRVASPGDRVVRTLNIVNAGPSTGIATVTFDIAEFVPEGALNPNLADDVTLFWTVGDVSGSEKFATLVPEGRVDVAQLSLERGGETQVTVGFEMATAVETSRSLGADSTVLSFDVGVEMSGDTHTAPALPITGGSAMWSTIAVAAALLAIGWLLLVLRRRQPSCDDCGRRIRRNDAAFEVREGGAAGGEILCAGCAELAGDGYFASGPLGAAGA